MNERHLATADPIRDYIKREVRLQLRRAAMARTREDFVNRLVEVLIPALAHYYRIMLATFNNRTDQVDKWTEQEQEFLDQFEDRLQERTKAKGLNRVECAETALDELMDQDVARRRRETTKFASACKLKRIVPLPKDAHHAFIKSVREIVSEMFPD
jgi:hypothetical protein